MAQPTELTDPVAVRLERVVRLEDVRDDWIRLAEAAGHPFGTWEWASAWWRWFGNGRQLYTFACRDDAGRVVAILPLYVAATRPVRVARFLGYGDLHSPLCSAEHRPTAAAALLRCVRRGKGRCPIVLAEKLPGGQGWGDLLGGTQLASHPDPFMNLGLSWEDFLASRSHSFRSTVRRRERTLAKSFELTYRLADDPDRLDGDLDTLYRLHAERWGDASTGVFGGDRGLMHRELAFEALAQGWLRLWLLELDGEPVAAYYGWRYAGSEWFFQSGRDPRFIKQSVGATLLAHVVRDACDDGVAVFRFLAGDEAYKFRWTDQDEPAETRLLGSSTFVRLAAVAVLRANSYRSRLRRRPANRSGPGEPA
jgi:CelD/BcsL family acetyltransferase involved in cellulose biosynthesis